MADPIKVKKALIPAAGRGLRSYPKSKHLPKGMFEIENRPILENTISVLRDQMKIRDITMIVGHQKEKIISHFKDGAKWDVTVHYIECPDPDCGLAQGVLTAEEAMREPFVCILGDEYYSDSNHHELTTFPDDAFAVCAIKSSNDIKEIRKNYTIEMENNRITKIVEKPTAIHQWYLGCGTYLLRPDIFEWIRQANTNFMETLDYAIKHNRIVKPFFLKGNYFNINSIEDINQCNYVIRSSTFSKKKVSLIIPAYNEALTIATVIKDALPHVDEVIVVDNQSTDETAEVSRRAGARVEQVRLKGYGDTIRHGLDDARGDILIIMEADHSFRSKDFGKFLEYIKDADMVIGTRTTRQLIEQGANMNGWLRLGNLVVAKLVELLWWESGRARFTDVGCTYRAIWKEAYLKIRNDLHSTGPEFSLEMMIKLLKYKQRILEIPISYYPRLEGMSKHSNNWIGIFKTALRMLHLTFIERFIRK